jgi:hypothetical protein
MRALLEKCCLLHRPSSFLYRNVQGMLSDCLAQGRLNPKISRPNTIINMTMTLKYTGVPMWQRVDVPITVCVLKSSCAVPHLDLR